MFLTRRFVASFIISFFFSVMIGVVGFIVFLRALLSPLKNGIIPMILAPKSLTTDAIKKIIRN